MPLSIIGAGYVRTGTLSLKLALEKLGFGPCHHGFEIGVNPAGWQRWERALDGQPVDWEEIFRDYRATVDFPACLFYRELANRYPAAKVILTERDPDAWFSSVQATFRTPAVLELAREHAAEPHMIIGSKITRTAFGEHSDDRDAVIEAYERHNAQVRATIPPERLLVYDVAQGWEPLCLFLGTPIPDVPFPRSNSRTTWPQDVASARQFSAEYLAGQVPTCVQNGIDSHFIAAKTN